MADLRAVLICSAGVCSSINDKKTGIAANGFTTENNDVKLANSNAPAPIKSVENGMISLKKSMLIRYRDFAEKKGGVSEFPNLNFSNILILIFCTHS